MKKEIKTWYLQLLDHEKKDKADHLLESPLPQQTDSYKLEKISHHLPELNRFLYLSVGAPWCWYERLTWTYADWCKHLEDPSIQTWVAYKDGLPIGYFELCLQRELQEVEITYFGLLPFAIGKGFGKMLLEDAIAIAWKLGGKRVWLHTCTLDHPKALSNYLARGFQIFKEEKTWEELPDKEIQPWELADKPLEKMINKS
ncbi:MAG: GNAT superfamily N-acetyltransferase [Candidatus Azotimanducaceae bacterium]|jgi:GNAT superfamily N-acetyltransferase